ncbi:hypothetical protein MATL_G00022910 [Megalops atlanticus]|uniref:Ig-like domain-containing protein n=1 Tax=Megalops atlanticus TaxID=7932 RepID=A0A9D3TCA1_MEGAT|nr:hypothetical protein MATL_G00022910 [Megalops atlanticus]
MKKVLKILHILSLFVPFVVGENLNETAGGTVSFPHSVKKEGVLKYENETIGQIIDGQSQTNLSEHFAGRLLWNSSTGYFSITDLKPEDSGEYRVHTNGSSSSYNLTVSGEFSMTDINRTAGGTVSFPHSVKKEGVLKYENETIGRVTDGQSQTNLSEQFAGRLLWNSSTGCFRITALKPEDSGEYRVHSHGTSRVYTLTVSVAISKPTTKAYRYGNGTCIALCYTKDWNHRLRWVRMSDNQTMAQLYNPSEKPWLGLLLNGEDKDRYKCVVERYGVEKFTIIQKKTFCNTPVSKPKIEFSGCHLRCSVENGTDVTLSLFLGNKMFVYITDPSTPLTLSVIVEKRGIFRCEAKNHVSNETLSIKVDAICSGNYHLKKSFLVVFTLLSLSTVLF